MNLKWLLSYNRNFVFINGKRSIGKTYSVLTFLISEAIVDKENKRFIYLVRTNKEKESAILRKATSKVVREQFKKHIIEYTNTELIYKENEDDKGTVIAECLSLNEAYKMKKSSFSEYKYMFFDEYILEDENFYLNNEVNLFLNLYHTIDRDCDKLKVIFCANNINFYNIYHTHEAFNISQKADKKGIYKNKFCVYYNCQNEEIFNNKKSKFSEMIENTDYNLYNKNEYFMNTPCKIKSLSRNYKNIGVYKGIGVWYNGSSLILSEKYNKNLIENNDLTKTIKVFDTMNSLFYDSYKTHNKFKN